MMRLSAISLSLGVAYASGECASSWTCPAQWAIGDNEAPEDAPDAKAFTAAHNIYRCMHNVQAVQWDHGVYKASQSASNAEGTENRAKTFPFSEHRGVDAAHIWYSEIAETCEYRPSCFQKIEGNDEKDWIKHFASMIWSKTSKVGYSARKGANKLAKADTVAHYATCDGKTVDFADASASTLPAPVKDYAQCEKEVLACSAFSDLKQDDVDGCDGASHSEGNVNMVLTMKWEVKYPKKCKDKYANLLDRIRLFEKSGPVAAKPVADSANVLMVLSCSMLFALVVSAVFVRKSQECQVREFANQVELEAQPFMKVDGLEFADDAGDEADALNGGLDFDESLA